jgi:hypothetical protein
MFKIRILIELPALDRLVDFLVASEQSQIDAATNQLEALRARLEASRLKLTKELEK